MYFVFENIYGAEYVSYNVHGLLHICGDVTKFGTLDNFSAFRFENYMDQIKTFLRKSEKPLQQLVRRYTGIDNLQVTSDENKFDLCEVALFKKHHRGPVMKYGKVKAQYKCIAYKKINMKVDSIQNNIRFPKFQFKTERTTFQIGIGKAKLMTNRSMYVFVYCYHVLICILYVYRFSTCHCLGADLYLSYVHYCQIILL